MRRVVVECNIRGRDLGGFVAEAQEATTTWRERARRIAGEDEESAIECLRRSKAAERRATRLARRAAEHERVEGQLARDVQDVDQRLGGLKEQRNLLRTRQARAEALTCVAHASEPTSAEMGECMADYQLTCSLCHSVVFDVSQFRNLLLDYVRAVRYSRWLFGA